MLRTSKVSLKKLNMLLFICITFMCGVIIFTSIKIRIKFDQYSEIEVEADKLQKAVLDLQDASDYLTEQARLFAVTQNIRHMNNYFNEVYNSKRRELSVDFIESKGKNLNSLIFLKTAYEKSIALEKQEFYSMKLIVEANEYVVNIDNASALQSIKIPVEVAETELSPRDSELSSEEKIQRSQDLLFSPTYMKTKSQISELKANALSDIYRETDRIKKNRYDSLKKTSLNLFACIVLILILNGMVLYVNFHYVVHPIFRLIRNIEQEQKFDEFASTEMSILSNTYNRMVDKNEVNERLLRYKAEHDELTGLINRVAFNNVQEKLTNSESKIAMIILDVDFFKNINDTYGHLIGDKVLQNVAKTLSNNFNKSDFVARVGGDEFSVIIIFFDDEEKKKLESTIKTIISHLNSNPELPNTTLSIGIAFSDCGYTEELFEHADEALYEVKKNGRNGYRFYNA